MKLVFSGAAHEVTGSCHYLNVCGKNILLDCGMEQGRDIYEIQVSFRSFTKTDSDERYSQRRQLPTCAI